MVNRKEYEKGQILLIVVLVMVTALTIGLSVASRTITNLRSTTEEENSERAFSAAEAGLERSLQTNMSILQTTPAPNHSSFSTKVTPLSGQSILTNNGGAIIKDDAVDIWLSNFPDYASPWTGTLTVYWGSSSDTCSPSEANNTQAALEIVLLTGTRNNPQVKHYPVDPCATRASYNHFESPSPGGTVSGKTFAYSKTINIATGLIMRIIPLYAPATVGVTASADLPSQGSVIESTGFSDTSKRKIVTFKGNPRLPTEVFPYVLFAPK